MFSCCYVSAILLTALAIHLIFRQTHTGRAPDHAAIASEETQMHNGRALVFGVLLGIALTLGGVSQHQVFGQEAEPAPEPPVEIPSEALFLGPLNSTLDAAPSTLIGGLVDSRGEATGKPDEWASGGEVKQDRTPDGNGFALLSGRGASIESTAFTINPTAKRISFDIRSENKDALADLKFEMVAADGSKTGELTRLEVCDSCGEWTRVYVYVEDWAGRNVRFRLSVQSDTKAPIAIDNIGANLIQAKIGIPRRSVAVADPVDTSTGNFQLTRQDFSIPTKGLPLEFTRYYNSFSAGTVSRVGRGWRHTYSINADLFGSGTYPSLVVINYADGRVAEFDYTGSPSNYSAPDGVFDKVSCDGSYCTLTTKNQIKYRFRDSSPGLGELVDIKDRNGNTTTVSYLTAEMRKINHVTAPDGRVLDFIYGENEEGQQNWGDLEEIELSDGRSIFFGPRGTNQTLTSFTDVTGAVWTYGYATTTATVMTSETPPGSGSNVFHNTYDTSFRVVRQSTFGGVTCFFFYPNPTSTSGCTAPSLSMGTTKVKDPRGYTTTYSYDEESRTYQVTYPGGGNEQVVYDDDSNPTCSTDALGYRVRRTFDSMGNMLSEYLPSTHACGSTSGSKWTFTYTSLNDPDIVTDPTGKYVDYTYNTAGNLTSEYHKSSGGTTLRRFCHTVNSAGQVTESQEDCSSTRRTRFTYNTNGDVTSVISPRFSSGSGPSTTMTYDTGGRKLTQTNELSHTTTWTYNNRNQVLTVKDHLGNTTTNAYDSRGRLTSVTDAMGAVTTYSYNNADWLTSVVDAAGGTTTYFYDANGNRTKVTNARGKDTTSTYDSRNRVASVTDALGITNFAYDDASNLTERAIGNVRTLYTYDAGRRVTEVEYRDGSTFLSEVDYTYDTRGNRTQMVDPTGTTTYAYDGMNQITSVTSPGSVTVAYQYSIVGDRTRITYQDTKQVNYTYDTAHNLATVTDWLSKVTAYAYDDAGNLTTTTLPASTGIVTTRTYDTADRLKKVENKQGANIISSFEYGLSAVGNRTSMLTPTEHTHYGYDNLQRLTSVIYSTPGASASDDFQSGNFTGGAGWPAAWSNTGSPSIVNVSGARHANLDTTDAMTRSVAVSGTITSLQFRARASSLESGEFAYAEVSPDGSGWTALKTFDSTNDDGNWHSYEYDVSAYEGSGTLHVRFRIQGSNSSDDLDVDDVSVVWGSERDSYTYDAVGNRLTKNATAYTYGDADQMLTANGVNYGYDARGNQTSRGSDTFTFDQENRMTAATIASANSTYTYNGDGVRVSKTAGGITTNYVQDVASTLPVVLQDGTDTYVYGLGLISITDNTGVQTYRLTDGLGSTTDLVDASGNVIVAYTYDPFGAIRTQTTPNDNEWLFTGEQRDPESGYDFLRARYYDSELGRFLGQDPLGGGYAYGTNSPLSLTDPSGLFPICPGDLPFDFAPPEGVAVDDYGCFESTLIGMPYEPPYQIECDTQHDCSFYFGYAYYAYNAHDWLAGARAFEGWYDASGDGVLDTYATCVQATGCVADSSAVCDYFVGEFGPGCEGYSYVGEQMNGDIYCAALIAAAGAGARRASRNLPGYWRWVLPGAAAALARGLC